MTMTDDELHIIEAAAAIADQWIDPERVRADVSALVAEIHRLRERVRIAQDALGQIVHDYDGCEVAACRITPGVVADDALTRMAAVEYDAPP